jgi:hypothetical protein
MATLYNYMTGLVLLGWILGVLFLDTDSTIHLFLLIGIYAALHGFLSSGNRKRRPRVQAQAQSPSPAFTNYYGHSLQQNAHATIILGTLRPGHVAPRPQRLGTQVLPPVTRIGDAQKGAIARYNVHD